MKELTNLSFLLWGTQERRPHFSHDLFRRITPSCTHNSPQQRRLAKSEKTVIVWHALKA